MVNEYRKKPVIIEAIQWTGDNISEIYDFVGENAILQKDSNSCILKICTLEGSYVASIDDYIIKGVQGEFYPCKPKIFEETYELINK